MNKLNYFQSVVYGTLVDCFCVTESWLYANIFDSKILPTNYTIYRRDRINKGGGGVMIAVSNKIPSRQIPMDSELEINMKFHLRP